jgi:arylsulfatase A-like enzyme
MAPLASVLAFQLIAVVILGVARATVRSTRWLVPVAIRVATFVFAGLAAYAVAGRSQFGLGNYAAVILSVGIATAIARLSAAQGAGVHRIVRFSSGAMAAAALIASAIGLSTFPSSLEHRGRSGTSATSSRPNILLIMLDTQRASNMSLYGYERETTPNLRQFASHGVVFDRAIATAPWTLTSHASVFTGRYPHELSADIGKPLDGTYETLAEVLADAGYVTAAFVANQFYTTEASGLARGFARYEDYPINARTFVNASWLSATLIARPLKLAHRTFQQKDDRVTTSFLRFANENDAPFFVFLNYMGAHAPYPSSGVFSTDHPSPANISKRQHITTEDLEGVRTAYDNGIAGTDREIGRVLRELARLGKLDQTIVVVAGDHGEHLGEHGLQEHTNSLYMSLLEVPLVVVHPGDVPQGTRVPEPVSLRDIPATVLELAGLSAEEIGGHSLSRHWNQPSRDLIEPVLAELNYWGAEQDLIKPWDPVYGGSMKSFVLGDWHYIRGGRADEEVFNLSNDPDELVNLRDTLPEVELRRLRAILDSIIR